MKLTLVYSFLPRCKSTTLKKVMHPFTIHPAMSELQSSYEIDGVLTLKPIASEKLGIKRWGSAKSILTACPIIRTYVGKYHTCVRKMKSGDRSHGSILAHNMRLGKTFQTEEREAQVPAFRSFRV